MSEHTVEFPGGGSIDLLTDDEVDRWNTLNDRYRGDYDLTKINELAMLGSIIMQHITIYRATRALSGIEDINDDEGLPTGQVRRRTLKISEIKAHQETITASSKEIREGEKALGIDKKSRDAGGKDTLADYVRNLKTLGRLYAIHVLERVQAYEELAGELRWRIRLMENGDTEDIAYHECNPEGILRWAKETLEMLEEKDKAWANQHGKLYVGTV